MVDKAGAGQTVQVITDATPFYGESGGQIGDHGVLRGAGFEIEIEDAIKPGGDLIVHLGKVLTGNVAVGGKATLVVNDERRDAIRRNHSATHLLHLALKEVLGSHVQQKGSLVAPDRLRFDYAHFEAVTEAQIA